jgi:hypothetical protein
VAGRGGRNRWPRTLVFQEYRGLTAPVGSRLEVASAGRSPTSPVADVTGKLSPFPIPSAFIYSLRMMWLLIGVPRSTAAYLADPEVCCMMSGDSAVGARHLHCTPSSRAMRYPQPLPLNFPTISLFFSIFSSPAAFPSKYSSIPTTTIKYYFLYQLSIF